MRHPLLLRALAIALIALAILVPIQLIRGKVAERQALAEGVARGFADETSGAQVVVGPFLAITCEETYPEERQVMRGGKAETIREAKVRPCPTAYFTPRTFSASADVPVQSLHRGLYPIRSFRAATRLQGEIAWPGPPDATPARLREWKHAYLVTFVRDSRGVKTIASAQSGSLLAGLGESGVDAFTMREDLGDWGERKPGTIIPFRYEGTLVGTGSFEIAPVGDVNEIRIASNWPHPSFSRGWAPDERSVDAGGFSATWRINSVATGGNAAWQRLASEGKLANAHGAGAAIFDPVNVFSLSYRATEYAFLFVLFTFAALAATEAVAGVRLHPIQYALVGCALAVFFLLLIGLSEHIAFARAYASAAAACIMLMTFYLRRPLASRARAAAFFLGFGAMYATLYVMLQSEDSALLMGSLLVFGLLATVMIATRRMDWAAITRRMVPPATPAVAAV